MKLIYQNLGKQVALSGRQGDGSSVLPSVLGSQDKRTVALSSRYKKPRYDEEESALLEREAKRILDRMIDKRREFKNKTEKENQELISECEEMTPDDIL